MVIKKIYLCLLLLTLGSCGYEPMYSKKEILNTTIQSFQLEGDKTLNRKIISSLNIKNQNETDGYKLIINSSKKIEAASKDTAGNISIFKTTITIKVSLIDADEVFKEKIFSSNFTYNNMENKFDLSRYQQDIEISLINKITEEIFIFLTLK
tara:strand:+ start:837 stop:1292 length:456 start_codon:yes stop_codon:yes gene_type:complete